MVERARFRPRLPPGRVSWRRPRDRFGRPCHDRRAARREVPDSGARAHRDRGDSVNASDLEVFQTALSLIPEEMGVALRRTAYSPNIKERMDASCAMFDADGRILEPQKRTARGGARSALLERFLRETAKPLERLGDLRAQVAANELGARRLIELVERIGVTRHRQSVDELLDYGERRVRAAIGELPRGTWAAEEFLEGASPEEPERIRIHAEVTIGGSGIAVDFEGTDRQVAGNLNAPFAVTLSAASYVVRCLTDPDAPRNAGSLRPLRVLAREGGFVWPRPPGAVAAGDAAKSPRVRGAPL